MAQRTTRGKSAKKSTRASGERYEKALEGLERGLKALYKGDADRAKEQFERLQEAYPAETELMDRVRSYLVVCERQLVPQRRPRSAEEMANFGVMYLNERDPQQAIKHLSKALELEPKSAHIQYCLAAAHALSGDASATAKHLKQAIHGDPFTRIHARTDADFASVRDTAEIAELLAET